MREHDKTKSKLDKKINLLHKIIVKHQESLLRRKQFITSTNLFIKKLLDENRVTKDELREYFKPVQK